MCKGDMIARCGPQYQTAQHRQSSEQHLAEAMKYMSGKGWRFHFPHVEESKTMETHLEVRSRRRNCTRGYSSTKLM